MKLFKKCIKTPHYILKQNYFTYNNQYFHQEDGLAMGSPISCFLAEIYMNHFENRHIFNNNNTYKNYIIFYSRYVDDTFIIYNGTNRQLENFKSYLNKINKNIQFTLEIESNSSINFLDLTIQKTVDEKLFKIYRKATTTVPRSAQNHIIHMLKKWQHTIALSTDFLLFQCLTMITKRKKAQ